MTHDITASSAFVAFAQESIENGTIGQAVRSGQLCDYPKLQKDLTLAELEQCTKYAHRRLLNSMSDEQLRERDERRMRVEKMLSQHHAEIHQSILSDMSMDELEELWNAVPVQNTTTEDEKTARIELYAEHYAELTRNGADFGHVEGLVNRKWSEMFKELDEKGITVAEFMAENPNWKPDETVDNPEYPEAPFVHSTRRIG